MVTFVHNLSEVVTVGPCSLTMVSQQTLDLANRWLQWDSNPETRAEIEKLLQDNDEKELQARLGKRISFGTAGSFIVAGLVLNRPRSTR